MSAGVPVVHPIGRHIAQLRVDDNRLLDAGVYARSIMSIARGMTALPRPGSTCQPVESR